MGKARGAFGAAGFSRYPGRVLEVYADNLRGIMSDLIAAIDNPARKLRVTLDDAIEAVRVAEMATRGM